MKLSEFETEILQIFWQHPQASAPEVHKIIFNDKEVTYSTVKTIIDRLEQKGAIQRVAQNGRTILYAASASANSMRKPLLENFINKVFGGNSRLLMNHLLENDELSQEDLAYLKQVVNKSKEDS
jgi:BlaI family penicillinase repressor